MSDEITTGRITVDGLGAYLARPVGGDGGRGMLLLPMITGIGEKVREFAHDIARAGITALSWDPFHGASTDEHTIDELRERMGGLDDETALGEQRRLLDHMLGELGLRRVGTIGWCLGGRFTLLLAGREPRLASAIAFHPTVTVPPLPNHTLDAAEHAAASAAPVMMLYPGQDSLVPHEAFHSLQSALHGRESAPTVVHLYPQAGHGFGGHEADGSPGAEAHAQSWPQALAFMRATTEYGRATRRGGRHADDVAPAGGRRGMSAGLRSWAARGLARVPSRPGDPASVGAPD